jgi:predicted enzyme related to lactoylglutathione lyase
MKAITHLLIIILFIKESKNLLNKAVYELPPLLFLKYSIQFYSNNMPTIVHFEIPADDVERSRKFYTDLFGWKIEKWPGMDSDSGGSSNMEYWVITTTDEKGNKALIGGGMMKRQKPHEQITNFIDVKSVDEYSSKIEKLGGKVVVPKMAVPGMGYFAVGHDTENNSFGIWESNESAK